MKEYLHNCLNAAVDKKGFCYAERFYREQYAPYSINGMYRFAFGNQSHVNIGLLTDATKLSFSCKTGMDMLKLASMVFEPMTPYQIHAKSPKKPKFRKGKDANAFGGKIERNFEVYVDGVLKEKCKVRNGKVEIEIENPVHKWQEVRIYYPYLMRIGVKNLCSNGNMKSLPRRDVMLCMGDSITEGWNTSGSSKAYASRVARELNLDILNQGVTGFVFSPESLNGLEKLPFAPRFVTCAYGTNDWQRACSMQEVSVRVKGYFKKLNALFPEIPIFVITPLWRADEGDALAIGSMEKFRVFIKKEAFRYTNMKVIDGSNLIAHDVRYFQDGMLHPNDAGAEIMAKALVKIIRQQLGTEQM